MKFSHEDPYTFSNGRAKIYFYGDEFEITSGDPKQGVWISSPLVELRTEIDLEGTKVVVFDYISEGLV